MSDEIPQYLYHVTAPDNEEPILEEGLTSRWGNYMSGDPQHALRFMGFRLRHQYVGQIEDELPLTEALEEALAAGLQGKVVTKDDGTKVAVVTRPDLKVNDHAVVFTIDRDLIGKPVEIGDDHNPMFFGDATSFVVYGDVPPEAIVATEYYDLTVLDKPKEASA